MGLVKVQSTGKHLGQADVAADVKAAASASNKIICSGFEK